MTSAPFVAVARSLNGRLRGARLCGVEEIDRLTLLLEPALGM